MKEQTQNIINAIEAIEGHNAQQFDVYLMLFDVPQEAIATREMLVAHIGATLDHIANNIIETEFEGCDIDGADWEDVTINLYDIDDLCAKYGIQRPIMGSEKIVSEETGTVAIITPSDNPRGKFFVTIGDGASYDEYADIIEEARAIAQNLIADWDGFEG